MRDAMAAVRAQQRRETAAPLMVQQRMDRYVQQAFQPALDAIQGIGTNDLSGHSYGESLLTIHTPRIPSQIKLRQDTDRQQLSE